ncbi:hypothetical protein AN958_11363 [Leucoagaricus sp. SymC.cos]|nr:hypothetical protein AN958_11363 [Leucoagaricus sp. SymC.cos]
MLAPPPAGTMTQLRSHPIPQILPGRGTTNPSNPRGGSGSFNGSNNTEGTTLAGFGALGGISGLLFAIIALFWSKYPMNSVAEHAIWLMVLFTILTLITASMGFVRVRIMLRRALCLSADVRLAFF